MRTGLKLVLILLMAMVMVACGSSEPEAATTAPVVESEAVNEAESADEVEDESDSMLPEVDPLDVSGDIVSAGSSTVFPLAEAMIARFVDEGYGDNATYDSIGSGGGFERFCVNSESDVAGASRRIKDSEIEDCQANGREPIEFRVGTDALAVVVSKDNDFADDVTHEELAAIFSTAETWEDVREGWPAEPILRYVPGTDSGTFDYFVEEVFDEDEAPILSASNLELSEDDNVLVQGAQASPYGVAFFGYAYFSENEASLKALSIDGVAPAKENVDNSTYPIARPLYIYSTASIMAEKPQVAEFVNFFLTTVDEEIERVGYFPASEEDLNASKQSLIEAMP